MAIVIGGSGDRRRHFCHSCGGVTVLLTTEEAAAEIASGHHLEVLNCKESPFAGTSASPAGNPVARPGQSSEGGAKQT